MYIRSYVVRVHTCQISEDYFQNQGNLQLDIKEIPMYIYVYDHQEMHMHDQYLHA